MWIARIHDRQATVEQESAVIEKLRCGVLRLKTPLGVRYVQPTFQERVYLLWVFRHFADLPAQVLTQKAQALVADLFSTGRSSQPGAAAFFSDQPIIGTVERMPQPGESPSPASGATIRAREGVAWERRS
jgi:hypothetical protein